MERAGQRARGSDKKGRKGYRVQWAEAKGAYEIEERERNGGNGSRAGEEGMWEDKCTENKRVCANPAA